MIKISVFVHKALLSMLRFRWKQSKRFLHIEDPDLDGIYKIKFEEDKRFYHKVQWLVEHISDKYSVEAFRSKSNGQPDTVKMELENRSKNMKQLEWGIKKHRL